MAYWLYARQYESTDDAFIEGDIVQVIPDRGHVGFMYSYSNLIPLPEGAVGAIALAVQPFGGTSCPEGATEARTRTPEGDQGTARDGPVPGRHMDGR